MVQNKPNQCDICRHLILEWGLNTCDAYPNGIPPPLRNDEVKHDHPYPGDNGIMFERVTDAELFLQKEGNKIIEYFTSIGDKEPVIFRITTIEDDDSRLMESYDVTKDEYVPDGTVIRYLDGIKAYKEIEREVADMITRDKHRQFVESGEAVTFWRQQRLESIEKERSR